MSRWNPLSPEIACSLAEGSSTRTISYDAGGVEQEIILDSGADQSALLPEFCWSGDFREGSKPGGNPLPVQVRMVEVVIGNVSEFFIIAPVSGRLYRA